MADIISSSNYNGNALMRDFKKVVTGVNKAFKKNLQSPLTITLGDEFQGIGKGLAETVEIIIAIEEAILEQELDFKLRYVLHWGAIDTPINPKIAYGMLGEGLTHARQSLEGLKHTKELQRFHVDLGKDRYEQAKVLNLAFSFYQTIVDGWKVKDFELVDALLKHEDYKIVADKMKKDRSLIWKRERSLKMKNYQEAKQLVKILSGSNP